MSPGTLALTATPRGSLQGFRKAVPYSLGDQLWASLVLGVYPAGSGSQEPAGWGSVPGRQREAQSSPAWTQLTEAGAGSAAQAPAANVPTGGGGSSEFPKPRVDGALKIPASPAPSPVLPPSTRLAAEGPLVQPPRQGSSARPRAGPLPSPARRPTPPHPGSLLSCRPLPLLGVPWATCGGGGVRATPLLLPPRRAASKQSAHARAHTRPRHRVLVKSLKDSGLFATVELTELVVPEILLPGQVGTRLAGPARAPLGASCPGSPQAALPLPPR